MVGAAWPNEMPQPDTIVETAKQPEREPVNLHYDTRLTPLPWTRRIQIPFIAAAVYSVIRTLGPTLRYEVLGWQHAEKVHASGKRIIWAFWHRIILPKIGRASCRERLPTPRPAAAAKQNRDSRHMVWLPG